MPLPPLLQGARLEAIFTLAGQRMENVFNFLGTGNYTDAQLTDLGNNWITWWNTNLKPLQAAPAQLIQVDVTALNSPTAPAITTTQNGFLPAVCGNGGGALPNNVTIAVQWKTPFRGKAFRGRTYHIALPAAAVNLSTIVATHQTALLAAYTAMIGVTDSNGGVLCVVSYILNGVPRASGLATPVSSVAINQTTDSQRRRLPERGE